MPQSELLFLLFTQLFLPSCLGILVTFVSCTMLQEFYKNNTSHSLPWQKSAVELQASDNGKCFTGITDGLWDVQVPSSPLPTDIHMQTFPRALTSGISSPDRNPALPQKQSQNKGSWQWSLQGNWGMIYLTDFILKYRCSCLLPLPSSAPIWLGNKCEVRPGQKKKILLREM